MSHNRKTVDIDRTKDEVNVLRCFQMDTCKSWDSTVPFATQPYTSHLNSTNNGYFPTIDSMRSQTMAPPLPPRIIPPSIGLYPSANYDNSPPQSNVSMSHFSQLAIEESRSAFHSIESLIQTFRSVSNMFESTFNNVYTSFRAMTDLYDHFIRLRAELTTMYPLILIWRFCKYFLNRLLKFLHLRESQGNEKSWSTIYENLQADTSSTKIQNEHSSSFFLALFFLVSFGTPMLMLKFFSSILKKRQIKQINPSWLKHETNHARVIALHDYVARNPDELSFTRGNIIYLAPAALQSSSSHWFLGTIDRIHTGLIPANYVQPIRPSSSQTHHHVSSDSSSPGMSSKVPNGEEQTVIC